MMVLSVALILNCLVTANIFYFFLLVILFCPFCFCHCKNIILPSKVTFLSTCTLQFHHEAEENLYRKGLKAVCPTASLAFR